MAMLASRLANGIKAKAAAKMSAAIGPPWDEIAPHMDKLLTAMSEAVAEATLEEITTFGQLNGLVITVASVSAVIPGVGVSGPGTGTGTGAPGTIS